jgi:hypothetical protein
MNDREIATTRGDREIADRVRFHYAMHLAAWVTHLASIAMPVEIIDAQMAFEANAT